MQSFHSLVYSKLCTHRHHAIQQSRWQHAAQLWRDSSRHRLGYHDPPSVLPHCSLGTTPEPLLGFRLQIVLCHHQVWARHHSATVDVRTFWSLCEEALSPLFLEVIVLSLLSAFLAVSCLTCKRYQLPLPQTWSTFATFHSIPQISLSVWSKCRCTDYDGNAYALLANKERVRRLIPRLLLHFYHIAFSNSHGNFQVSLAAPGPWIDPRSSKRCLDWTV